MSCRPSWMTGRACARCGSSRPCASPTWPPNLAGPTSRPPPSRLGGSTTAAAEEPVYQPDLDGAALQEVFARLLARTDLVLRLLSTGVFHDRNRDHCYLWVASLQQLMRARARFPACSFQGQLDYARHYPALLALRAMGIIAVDTGRDDILMRLCTEPTWRDIFDTRERLPAWRALQEHRIASSNVVNAIPRRGTAVAVP